MEGSEFRKLDPKTLDNILPRLQVLARSSPQDKLILVQRLRTLGEVVAVTGDGTNDAPALKEADVGLSMGLCGTQVAKEASKIVIMDDNFTSIVKSVKWGRSVYDNIRKFLQFQLTVNVVALLVAFWGAVFQFGTPLTAVQLLWVNLIMDTLAALAFSTEKPSDDLLMRRPYGRRGAIISGIMWRNIISQAVYQFSLLMILLFAVDARGHHWIIGGGSLDGKGVLDGRLYKGHPSVHFTIIFNTFVFCQIFNEFNSRKCDRKANVFENLFSNYMFVIIILVTIGFQILCVQLFGPFTKTVPLNFNQWMLSIVFGFLCIPYAVIIRAAITPCIPIDPYELPAKEDKLFQFKKELKNYLLFKYI